MWKAWTIQKTLHHFTKQRQGAESGLENKTETCVTVFKIYVWFQTPMFHHTPSELGYTIIRHLCFDGKHQDANLVSWASWVTAWKKQLIICLRKLSVKTFSSLSPKFKSRFHTKLLMLAVLQQRDLKPFCILIKVKKKKGAQTSKHEHVFLHKSWIWNLFSLSLYLLLSRLNQILIVRLQILKENSLDAERHLRG